MDPIQEMENQANADVVSEVTQNVEVAQEPTLWEKTVSLAQVVAPLLRAATIAEQSAEEANIPQSLFADWNIVNGVMQDNLYTVPAASPLTPKHHNDLTDVFIAATGADDTHRVRALRRLASVANAIADEVNNENSEGVRHRLIVEIVRQGILHCCFQRDKKIRLASFSFSTLKFEGLEDVPSKPRK